MRAARAPASARKRALLDAEAELEHVIPAIFHQAPRVGFFTFQHLQRVRQLVVFANALEVCQRFGFNFLGVDIDWREVNPASGPVPDGDFDEQRWFHLGRLSRGFQVHEKSILMSNKYWTCFSPITTSTCMNKVHEEFITLSFKLQPYFIGLIYYVLVISGVIITVYCVFGMVKCTHDGQWDKNKYVFFWVNLLYFCCNCW